MKRLLLFLVLPLCSMSPKPSSRNKIERHIYWDKDMNNCPLPGQIEEDIACIKMSYSQMRDKINEQSRTIRVLDSELHTYMIRTDLIVQRLEKLEKKAFKKPWYKRMFSCFKK